MQIGISLGVTAMKQGGGGQHFVPYTGDFMVSDRQTVFAGSGSGVPTMVRWMGKGMKRVIVRLPANAPGNVIIGLKSASQNYLIDKGNIGSTTYTLTPGNEIEFVGRAEALLLRSTASSAPANLIVEFECWYGPDDVASIAPVTRALTAKSQLVHSVANAVSYSITSPPQLSQDGVTWLGGNGLVLRYCTDFIANPTSPTWTNVRTFTDTGYTIKGFIELPNGEMLVFLGNGSISRVYKSSGWAADKATATWSLVLTSQGGEIAGNYSIHQWSFGANGVGILAVSGTQTIGGAGNVATDDNRAVRFYVTADFGSTFTTYDIRQIAANFGVNYPAGVHCHGVGYDEQDDALYLIYGDATGDGKNIAGDGNTQIMRSFDRGATWERMPGLDKWVYAAGGSNPGQFIAIAFTPQAIILTPDESDPLSTFVIRRAGYRQFGAVHLTMGMPGVGGKISRFGSGDARRYFITGIINFSQAAGTVTAPFGVSKDMFSWNVVTVSQTLASTGARGTYGVLGLTADNKVVIQTGNSVVIADLVYGPPA